MQIYKFRLRDRVSKKVGNPMNIRDISLILDTQDIEQYTGIQDSKGKDIYENDIVRVRKKVRKSVETYADAFEAKIDASEWETFESVGIVKYIAPSFTVYYPKLSLRLNFSEDFSTVMTDVFVLGDISNENLFQNFK